MYVPAPSATPGSATGRLNFTYVNRSRSFAFSFSCARVAGADNPRSSTPATAASSFLLVMTLSSCKNEDFFLRSIRDNVSQAGGEQVHGVHLCTPELTCV